LLVFTVLWAQKYYWQGNATIPCFRWPALNCDGKPTDPNGGNFYNGTNPKLRPGALLAVPPALSVTIAAKLKTPLAKRLLIALTDYGGYLDDNTDSDSGAFTIEGGVLEEVAAAYNGLSLSVGPGKLTQAICRCL